MRSLKIEPIENAENPGDVRIIIDGVEWRGIAGYQLTHNAGEALPMLMLHVPLEEGASIEFPDAQIQVMREQDVIDPIDQPRTRHTLVPALAAAADHDARKGVDIVRLAERYCLLGVRQRFTVQHVLGLISAEENALGMSNPKAMERLDREAIARALDAGKIVEFSVAVDAALDTYRAGMEEERVAPPMPIPAICLHPAGYNAAGLCFDCGRKIGMSIDEFAASQKK